MCDKMILPVRSICLRNASKYIRYTARATYRDISGVALRYRQLMLSFVWHSTTYKVVILHCSRCEACIAFTALSHDGIAIILHEYPLRQHSPLYYFTVRCSLPPIRATSQANQNAKTLETQGCKLPILNRGYEKVRRHLPCCRPQFESMGLRRDRVSCIALQ